MQGKRPDLPEPDSTDASAEVVGAYDDVDDTPSFVIADVTCGDAWLSIAVSGGIELDEWR